MGAAVVTGASRGIGAAIAREFKRCGWKVIGTSSQKVVPTVEFVDVWMRVDLGSRPETHQFCASLLDIPDLQACVNNAGINIIKYQREVTPEDYSVIELIDLESPYFVAKAAASRMAATGGGKIVNISSIWSIVSKEQRTLYSTMKTALLGLTRAMAVEWAASNVLVNSVSPGFVNTELTARSLTPDQRLEMAARVPLRRFAEPEEIAKAVVFLCSAQNSYITGQNVVVDGGFTVC